MINSFMVLLMIISTVVLHGDIFKHLKKAQDKGDGHSMRNIDFIYMINLDQRPEKWKLSQDQLNPFGIYPYRFSAVNGWELSMETINDVGVKFSPHMTGGFLATSYHPQDNYQPSHEVIEKHGQTYFVHCMARGTIGIALSHISILQDAYNAGYETIWVMEDDIEVMQDPRKISHLIDKLDLLVGKENWDVLFTDKDIRGSDGKYIPSYGAAQRPDYQFETTPDFANKTVISPDFRKVESRFGATSMIYRRSGIKKLLNFFNAHQIFLPYDMDFYLPRGIKMYTVLEDVVTNLTKPLSDNAKPYYLEKQ
jgi:GR25 family glycosyltransferase involved in LPS biosynthesis